MKYKIKSEMCATERDWVLWSGDYKDQCVQIAGLFRDTPCDARHSDTVDYDGNHYRYEQLTFQSRKAAARWIRKHKAWIIEDYKKRHCGRVPRWTMAAQWHGKGVFYMALYKI